MGEHRTKKTAKKCINSTMSESTFQRYILAAFDGDENVKMFRRNVGGFEGKKGQYIRFGQSGQSDLWGWITEHRCLFCDRVQFGTHFEIEVKSDKGKPTQMQLNWLQMVAENNGIAILVHPEPTDPVGLRNRILKLILGTKCPQCVESLGKEAEQ